MSINGGLIAIFSIQTNLSSTLTVALHFKPSRICHSMMYRGTDLKSSHCMIVIHYLGHQSHNGTNHESSMDVL